jgi:hypothetical protein
MKDVTMLIAHPDDEVIFGWPVLQRAKKIVCCSSDENNLERQWCKDRKLALKEICGMLGIELVCFDYNSEFYRLPTRDGSLLELQKQVVGALPDETIFTHNAWGEYGHLDHILVHQIARSSHRILFTTDMSINAGWMNIDSPINFGNKVQDCDIDLDLYNRCKAIYDKYGCWTWSKDPIMKASLYENH